MLILNRSGNSNRNPIVDGIHFQIKYHKHDANERFVKMWITTPAGIFSELTGSCVETDYTVTCDVIAGTDLESGDPPVLNVINVTTVYTPPPVEIPILDDETPFTSVGAQPQNIHVTGSLYVSVVPDEMILFDGYNAKSIAEPAIFRPNF
jgi:hypothetical protein